jgi:hypothetical protein
LERSPDIFDELVVPRYLHVAATCSDNTWLGRFPESVPTDLEEPLLQANAENFEAVVQIASSWWVQLRFSQH